MGGEGGVRGGGRRKIRRRIQDVACLTLFVCSIHPPPIPVVCIGMYRRVTC